MCGRYYIDYEVDLILGEIYESLFASGEIARFDSFKEVFPNTIGATLVADHEKNISVAAKRWGEKRGNLFVINARQETILERPMFRDAFRQHRSVIPASGFYEWASSGKNKQRYRIENREKDVMYMAGLYLPHPKLDRYVIITTASEGDMTLIHSRSPVILSGEEYPEYLNSLSYAKTRLSQSNQPLQITPEAGEGPVQLSFLDLMP